MERPSSSFIVSGFVASMTFAVPVLRRSEKSPPGSLNFLAWVWAVKNTLAKKVKNANIRIILIYDPR